MGTDGKVDFSQRQRTFVVRSNERAHNGGEAKETSGMLRNINAQFGRCQHIPKIVHKGLCRVAEIWPTTHRILHVPPGNQNINEQSRHRIKARTP